MFRVYKISETELKIEAALYQALLKIMEGTLISTNSTGQDRLTGQTYRIG